MVFCHAYARSHISLVLYNMQLVIGFEMGLMISIMIYVISIRITIKQVSMHFYGVWSIILTSVCFVLVHPSITWDGMIDGFVVMACVRCYVLMPSPSTSTYSIINIGLLWMTVWVLTAGIMNLGWKAWTVQLFVIVSMFMACARMVRTL